jgi:glycosyltransferase involved in cell wall biosynthesis
MPCQASIIIPTLNEEGRIARLLKSIKKQEFSDYEIIVADNNSSDHTRAIATNYGCKIVGGGLPAKGKNGGAKVAKGELLLFLDADAVLPENFLAKTMEEFNKRKLNVASFRIIPIEKKMSYRIALNVFYNFPIIALEKILPHGAMAILIEKRLFNDLGGFDEKIKLAEDHDLIRRAAKIGRYGIIKSVVAFASMRRFENDGWVRVYLKYIFCEAHMIFLGPVKSDIFNYKFGIYSKNKKNKS